MSVFREHTLQPPRPTRDVAEVEADLLRAGYGILEGALDAGTCTAIRDRLAAQAKAETEARIDGRNSAVEPDDDVNQWVTMLPNKGGVFRALVNNEKCLRLVRFMLGRDAILSEFSAHITWPGNATMGLHTDQWWLPLPAMPGADWRRVSEITRADQEFGDPVPATSPINPPVVCNAMWAISDFTEENGATRLVPGSHHSGRHPDPGATYDHAFAEAPAGSLVIWEGRTWHAASLNRSNGPRFGITTFWGGPQFRQLLNFTYGLRPEVAADLGDAERALMGFRVWGSYGATGNFDSEWASPGADNPGPMGEDLDR